MALTTEQQGMLDFNDANAKRHQRLDCIRIAKEVLVENRRLESSSEATDITTSDITTMATSFMTYIES
jgi:hypothetical protein